MAKARLETEITGSSVSFEQSVKQAEQRAQIFTGRLHELFRRTPDIRAERALDAFGARLAAGDIAGGIEAIATKITGLGLAAAVGFGIASAVAVKLGQDIKKNNDEIRKASELLATPEGVVAGLGASGIKKQTDDMIKSLSDLTAARESFGHTVLGGIPFADAFVAIQNVVSLSEGLAERHTLPKYFDDAAKAAERGVQIARLRVTGHEQEAKALEAVAKGQQKIAEIELVQLSREAQIRQSKLPESEKDALIKSSRAGAKREEAAAGTDEALALFAQYQAIQDKNRLSLKDVADVAKPRAVEGSEWLNRSGEQFMVEGNQNALSAQALFNARQARRAQELEAKADQLVKTQADTGEPGSPAWRLRQEALQARQSITTLKETEKEDPAAAFMQALTSTAVPVLEQIRDYVAKLSFANQ